MQVIILVF